MRSSRPPVALAVIIENFQGRARAITEDVNCSIQRILAEGAPAYRRQPINSFTGIDRGQRDKNPTLRG